MYIHNIIETVRYSIMRKMRVLFPHVAFSEGEL